MAATAKRTGAMAAAALLFGLAASAQAESFSLEAGPRHLARLDEARWQLVEEAVFSCRLEHSVPVLGRAVFETRAGGRQRFHVEGPVPAGEEDIAEPLVVSTEAPPWAAPSPPVRLVSVAEELVLDAAASQRLLEGLYRGRLVVLQRPPRLHAALSPAGFRPAYRGYQSCLEKLLPVSHEQVAHSRILFASGQWELDDAARKRLDLVVRYVLEDDRVKRIRVAGHADGVGRQLHNLELSRRRAKAVADYLVQQGVDAERIHRSHHAHLKPAVAGNTASARDQNRRVSVRLEGGPGADQGV